MAALGSGLYQQVAETDAEVRFSHFLLGATMTEYDLKTYAGS